MINLFTVDIEDWQQSTLDQRLPISERALENSIRLLDLMDEHGVRGTFFVQSLVAEKYPGLVRRIVADGHELASHGHGHVPLFRLTPEELAADLRKSMDVLSAFSSRPVLGYRAPDFSIRGDTLWALDVVRRAGFTYSSSIYPFYGPRYGIPRALVRPYQIMEGLVEVPPSVVRFGGRSWPVAGGGYLRLLPYQLTRWAIQNINKQGLQAMVYIHPYDLNRTEIEQFRGKIPERLFLSQSLNRHKTATKLHCLMRDFAFAPIRDAVSFPGFVQKGCSPIPVR